MQELTHELKHTKKKKRKLVKPATSQILASYASTVKKNVLPDGMLC
jgi:hypothetical protein